MDFTTSLPLDDYTGEVFHADRWDEVYARRNALNQFNEEPSAGTLITLFDSLWAFEARSNVEQFVESTVLANTDIKTVHEKLFYPQTDEQYGVDTLLELDGVGPAVATEIMHTATPTRYAIRNKHSVRAVEATGYEVTSDYKFNSEAYRAFCQYIEHDLYNKLRLDDLYRQCIEAGVLKESPRTYPDGTDCSLSVFEKFDYLVYANEIPGMDMASELANRLEASRTRWMVPDDHKLRRAVRRCVSDDATYESIGDFLRSAVRNELTEAYNRPTSDQGVSSRPGQGRPVG